MCAGAKLIAARPYHFAPVQLFRQMQVLVAKAARQDWPTDWPGLVPELIAAFRWVAMGWGGVEEGCVDGVRGPHQCLCLLQCKQHH
jgi:hypothetical protein